MSERIGQLFMLGLANNQLDTSTAAAIRSDHFGSVWFIENSSLGTTKVRAITDSIQALSTNGVRFFIAANQEG
ncbi:MAG TPA: hypothetical protein VKV69_00345, partial [Actinomycetota bacterium]|nr:hypothetical protein [Actinomycetota bacterium]